MRGIRLIPFVLLLGLFSVACGDKSRTVQVDQKLAPAIGGIQPTRGLTTGGTVAVIRGLNFRKGATVTFGSKPATAVKVVDAQTLTVEVPAAEAGAVNVLVTNDDGQSTTFNGGFTYYTRDPSTASAPELASVAPNTGPHVGGTYALVTGTGFQEGALLLVGRAPASEVLTVSGQVLTGRVAAGDVGAADIEVTNPDGQTARLPAAFAYYNEQGTGPSVSEVTPVAGSTAGDVAATVVGAGFKPGALVFFGGRPATGVTAAGTSALNVRTPASAPGLVDVAVTNPDGRSDVKRGGYNYYVGGPVLLSVSPRFGAPNGGTAVVIEGRNFQDKAIADIGGKTLGAFQRLDERTLMGVTAASKEGPADVHVQNPDGQSDTLANAFNFGSAPVGDLQVTRLVPDTGPITGGTRLTVIGQGFDNNAQVTIGGQPVTSFRLLGPSSLSAVTPAGSVGPADVVVSTRGKQAKLTRGFWYFDAGSGKPAPSVTRVSPAAGPLAGGTTVLLTGTGFAPGARVFFGASEAGQVKLVSDTSVSAVAPAGELGPVDVRVLNPDGQVGLLAQTFVYVDMGTLGAAPAITTVRPNSGGTVDATAVTLVTQNAAQGATLFVNGVPATGVTVVAPESVSATFPPGPAGTVDVVLTNPDGQSARLVGGFTYVQSPPSLTSVAPSTVPLAGGITVLLSGRGFAPGATAAIDGAAQPTTFVDSTLVLVRAQAHVAGAVEVSVTNPDGQRSALPDALTYADIELGPAPTLTSIFPATGPHTGGTVALVQGTHLVQGAKVLFGSAASPKVVVMNANRLSVEAPAGAVGAVDVTLVNPDGQSAQLVKGFTYVDRSTLGAAPVLASVTPSQGVGTGGTQTVLTGTGFKSNMLVFYGGYTASFSAVQSAGIATATTPPGPQGLVDVVVTNADGQSSRLRNGYLYVAAPLPQSLAPSSGPSAGGTSFTLGGTGFASGAKVYFDATEATGVTVASSTVITGRTPAHAAGKVAVRVVNPDAQAGTLEEAFTFIPAPTATAVRPAVGPTSGQTAVLITGTGFAPGATVKFGAQTAPSAQVIDSSQVLALTPPGAVGLVDVVVTNPDGQSAPLASAFTYDTVDFTGGRSTTYADRFLPAVRDDAQYRTDVVVVNLSGKPTNVTLKSFDAAGTQLGARSLATPVPPQGRVVVQNALQFIEAVGAVTSRTASVVVQADGPVAPFSLVVDRTSDDASALAAQPAASGGERLLVPYATSVGAFKTWLSVVNAGDNTATVSIRARNAQGTSLGNLTGLVLPPHGQYSSDDILSALSVSGAVATLEISSPGSQLLAAARTYSNSRLGALVTARPYANTSAVQTLAYVPDTSSETSSLFVSNADGTNAAEATLSLHALNGDTLGTRNVTLPPGGFVQVADLARLILQKDQPTQTISSVRVSANRPVHAMALVLNTSNSDLRFYNARAGAGVRLLAPLMAGSTGLAVVNTGTAAANVELLFRVDSGAPRGSSFRLSIPPRGLFNAPVILNAIGAAGSSGYLEVRSLNGQPLTAMARVGTDSANGVKGDALDLGNVLTTPSLDSILPTTGPATGGTMARLKGEYFLPGATVLFGGALAQRSQVVDAETAVAVTPAGDVGASVDLTLLNFDGSRAVLPNAFGYVDPATLGSPPAIASVTPSQVSTLGGTALHVDGSNFNPNPLVFVGLSPATGVTQVNPNRIDGAAPAGPVGPADLTVTNTDGQSATLSGAVQYVVPPPSVATITPSSGPGGGGTAVRIVGNGFQQGAVVAFGAVNATNVNVLSATELELVAPPGDDGPVAVTVTNPDSQSVTVNNGFVYVAAPRITGVTPTSGPISGGTFIQISGKYFRSGATVTVGGQAATNVVVQAGGQVITCNTPAGSAGPSAVRVTNPDGQNGLLNNGFTYLAPVPPPTVTAVSPNYGPTTGGTQVTIQGSGFQAGATVRFGGITAVSATVITPSAITAVSPGAATTGAVTVEVINPDTQVGSLASGFNYFQPADLPAIAVVSLTPKEGPASGGNTVFISGQGFKFGVKVRFGGVDSPTVSYLGPSALQAVVPPHALGAVDVTAINPDGASATLAGGYQYTLGVVFNPPPMRLPMKVERGYGAPYLFDADLDGDLDAYLSRRAISCDNDGTDELWLNDGAGNFNISGTFPGDASRTTVAALFADFDANGTTDIVTITDSTYASSSNKNTFLKNNPLGVFTRSDLPSLDVCCSQPQARAAAVGDLNTDGRPDIYVAVGGLDYWYRNEGNGTFTPLRTGLPGINDDSRAVCISDFDRDGDDDVFVVNGSNQQANYFLQGPKGTFTLSNSLIPVVGGNGVGCTVAEFRPGSGVKDIVVVKAGQGYQYLRNDGTGRFTDEASSLNVHRLPSTPPSNSIGFSSAFLGSGTYLGGVAAVDLNLDGATDLLLHHYDLSPRIQAYINDGAGFFTLGTASRIPAFLGAEAGFAVGDVDSDLRPDVLLAGDGSQSRLLLNGPGGVLRNATMKTIPDANLYASDAVADDIDGDSDPDIIIASGCRFTTSYCSNEPATCRGDTVRFWISDGAGGYIDDTVNRFPAFTWSATEVASGDIDGDGDNDLLVGTTGRSTSTNSSGDSPGLRLYLNDGTGHYTDVTYPRIPFEAYFTQSISLIDINKDGALDVFVGIDSRCGCASQQRLYLNTGNGFFFNVSGQLPYTSYGCNGDLRTSTVGDFNGDTYPDIYVGMNGQNKMFFNRGGAQPGYFTDVTNSNIPNVSDNTYATVTGDLNNDNRPDLFICNGGSGNTGLDHIDLGNATGVLSDVTATNWPGESQPYPYSGVCSGGPVGPVNSLSCDLGDADGDGDLDIVITGADQSNINMRARYYRNVGNAVFEDRTLQSMPFDSDYGTKVQFLDANRDGKPDLFMGTNGQPRLYLNTP